MTQTMFDTAIRLQAFTQPHARALAWCLLGPRLQLPGNLTSPALEFSFDVDSDWLQWQNSHSNALNQHINEAKSPRLGIYYEQLWRFVFEHHPGFELLAHDQQVQHQGKTLGAMDFLVRYRNQIFHIETAIKFYLAQQRSPQPEQWLGPNCNDRLHTKLQRMTNHQLALSKHPAAQKWLQSLNVIPTSIHTRQIIQGFLFEPVLRPSTTDLINLNGTKNDHGNPQELQGGDKNKQQNKAGEELGGIQEASTHWQYWRYTELIEALTTTTSTTCIPAIDVSTSHTAKTRTPITEMYSSHNRQTQRRWVILPKSLWLAPYVDCAQKHLNKSNDSVEPLSSTRLLNAIKTHFSRSSNTKDEAASAQRQRPLLIAEVTDREGVTLERQRFFVVPDYWPW